MPVVGGVVEEHLVKSFEGLCEVVLEGGERGADGGRTEAVCDEGEMGEAALNAGLQDGGRPRVTEGSPVLGQQVCELLTELSAGERHSRTSDMQPPRGLMVSPSRVASHVSAASAQPTSSGEAVFESLTMWERAGF